jgi:predicted amidophosphoribosyltransferase
LHPKKQKSRGYNQAEIIAAALSKKMGVPLYKKVLIRVKNTTALARLGESERKD